jgi:2-polyprenyl-6-methoxyphenol hydroxylase-like FAD-dependent oxidoreductase
MTDRPILIAGAGIGGLTLAALLTRRGEGCLVLERAPRFGAVGAGIVLQPNAIRVLRSAGLESIARQGAATTTLQIRDSKGRVLSSIATSDFVEAFDAGVVGFHRATLHAALLDHVPGSVLQSNATVAAFRVDAEGVVVRLEDGTEIRGSALVGADGLRSAVRRQMLADGPPRYSGYTSYRGVIPRDPHWPKGFMCESWGSGARFGLVAIDQDRLYWFATANASEGGLSVGLGGLTERFRGWHEPIPAVIAATPDEALLHVDIHDREPVNRWSDGRVMLLGDAAHPMTPNLGQGGGQAIEDAVVLDRCLRQQASIESAFAAFELARRERTSRVVLQSRRMGALGQLDNRALCALRNLAVRGASSRRLAVRSMEWLYRFS